MLLNEANTLLKSPITGNQLEAIHPIYCLLDLDKEDFCKIIDAIGVDKFASKQERWTRLDRAEAELTKRQSYIAAKQRLMDLGDERRWLEEEVTKYQKELHRAITYNE